MQPDAACTIQSSTPILHMYTHLLHGPKGVEDDVEDQDHESRGGVSVLAYQLESHTVLEVLPGVAVLVRQVIEELFSCGQGWTR